MIASFLSLLLLAGTSRYASATGTGTGCKTPVLSIGFNAFKAGPFDKTAAFSVFDKASGYYDDPKVVGSTNRRARIVRDGQRRVLEVLHPKGCRTQECGMQAKASLPGKLETATLKFGVRFGDGFDWVKGGKLPGMCGATCPTGGEKATGTNGFSARHMWRSGNKLCQGATLTSYVYHTQKLKRTGDQLAFESPALGGCLKLRAGKWYTIWSLVRMNTADATGRNYKADGVLQTWVEGPGFPATLVVDRADMVWRHRNDVRIDTFYLSNFFGGGSDEWCARKDETIQFDGFAVYGDECLPKAAFPARSVEL